MSEQSSQPNPSERRSVFQAFAEKARDRLIGRKPSAETLEQAKEATSAVLEGMQLIDIARSSLTSEQQQQALLDEGRKGVENIRRKTLDTLKLLGKLNFGSPSEEELDQIERQLNDGTLSEKSLILDSIEAHRQKRRAERQLKESRGRLPDVSWKVEGDLSNRIETHQNIELAAAMEVAKLLQEVLTGKGLSTTVLSEATAYAKTFVREGAQIEKTMRSLVDHLAKRFPDQRQQLESHFADWLNNIQDQQKVETGELPQLKSEVIAQKAIDLVNQSGLGRETNKRELLKDLGVTFVRNEKGEEVPVVAKGSLAENLFQNEALLDHLKPILEGTVTSLAENPLKAVGALELAQQVFQVGKVSEKLKAQIEQLRVSALVKEEAQITKELADASRKAEAARRAQERLLKANQIYEDVKGGIRDGINWSKMVKGRIIEAAQRVKEATVDRAAEVIRSQARALKQEAEEIDLKLTSAILGQAAEKGQTRDELLAEIARLQAELQRLKGEEK